jgi:hypothetical protein
LHYTFDPKDQQDLSYFYHCCQQAGLIAEVPDLSRDTAILNMQV